MEFEGAELCTTERPEAQAQSGWRRACALEAGRREPDLTAQGTPPIPDLPSGCCANLCSFLTSLALSSKTNGKTTLE